VLEYLATVLRTVKLKHSEKLMILVSVIGQSCHTQMTTSRRSFTIYSDSIYSSIHVSTQNNLIYRVERDQWLISSPPQHMLFRQHTLALHSAYVSPSGYRPITNHRALRPSLNESALQRLWSWSRISSCGVLSIT